MTDYNAIQALIQSHAVHGWASSLLASKADTFRRSQAVQGLRGAAALAVGATRNVDVVVAKPLRDSAIVVDGHAYKLSFIRA